MNDLTDLKNATCGEQLERVRYFPRQLLTADDMRLEQEFFREKARRHNRYLNGWGVVCGCAVAPVPDATTWTVRVSPGYVVGPQGDEILIDHCVNVDLKLGAPPEPCTVRWPCPPAGAMPVESDGTAVVYIAVCYAECFSRPARVQPAGCGCDEALCEYSRVRDSFEIKLLWQLPESHATAIEDDKRWCDSVRNLAKNLATGHPFPVPPCPEYMTEPWVVLATITFPTNQKPGTLNARNVDVSFKNRRVLLATQRLQTAVVCLL